jgi:hypothetical protein
MRWGPSGQRVSVQESSTPPSYVGIGRIAGSRQRGDQESDLFCVHGSVNGFPLALLHVSACGFSPNCDASLNSRQSLRVRIM